MKIEASLRDERGEIYNITHRAHLALGGVDFYSVEDNRTRASTIQVIGIPDVLVYEQLYKLGDG